MIECTIDRNGTCKLSMKGSTHELALEVLGLISAMRKAIDNDDKIAGLIYARTILDGVHYAVLTDEEKDIVDRKTKKKDKEKADELMGELNNLKKILDDLKKGLEDVEEDNEPTDIRSADFDSEDEFMKWLRNDSNKEDE